MDKKLIIGLVALVFVATIVAIVTPGGRQVDSQPKLPWMILNNADGSTSVFGLTLGKSPLGEAEQILQNAPTLSLFRSPEGEYAIEAYFDRIYLNGLRADFVMSLEVKPDQAEAMFQRGLRISQLGNGTQKVELSSEDKQRLAQAPIKLITYLPGTDLEPGILKNHFGEPKEIIEEGPQISHWLYPEKGLDIAVNKEGKEVMQYLSPSAFDQAVAPLRQAQ